MKRYSETHEWVEVEAGQVRVGVSNFAQKELGDIVYVELPTVGKRVKAGGEVAVLESTKAAADVYSPLSGTILAVNDTLAEHPEFINSAAESDGWLYTMHAEVPEEMEVLCDAEAYQVKVRG